MPGLSDNARAEIEKLAINGSDCGISLTKVRTTEQVGNLIIGLGGSGADMVRETKALINQNCSADNDIHKSPDRIAYLCFDTDSEEKEKYSRNKAVGQVKLDSDEIVILPREALAVLLNPATRENQLKTYPYIYSWLDTNINPNLNGNGAGMVRQAGRAMLFLAMDKVIKKIDEALTKLIKGTDVRSINIYVLSGVSGGTGSGTFLDTAYIARKLAMDKNSAGVLKPPSICVFGYLLMPDVNCQNTDDRSRILLNAGAALQELDQAMKRHEVGEYYQCRYTNTFEVNTEKKPFDYLHLICSKANGGSMPADPYQHCLDTVAGSILCFASSRIKAGNTEDGGVLPVAEFPVNSYYANVGAAANTVHNNKMVKWRSSCYLSTGYDSWQIPTDRLVKYVFTLMFKEVDKLFDNEPTQEQVDALFNALQLGEEAIIDTLMQVHVDFRPGDYTYRELFNHPRTNPSDYYDFKGKEQDIRKAYDRLVKKFEENFKHEMNAAFRSPAKGPYWINHALLTQTNYYEALDTLIDKEKAYIRSKREEYRRDSDNASVAIDKKMQGLHLNIPGNSEVADVISLYNRYHRAQMRIYCYDLILGDCKEGDNQGFYEKIESVFRGYNHDTVEIAYQFTDEMARVVKGNTDDFKNANVKLEKHGFTWSAGEIPELDSVIDGILKENGFNADVVMRTFLQAMLDKTSQWAEKGVDARAFIEDFMKTNASDTINTSMEKILQSCFTKGVSLEESVCDSLMPNMTDKALPLFDGNAEVNKTYVVTIPTGCNSILKGVQRYKAANNQNINIETSYLRNRISVICTTAGIALHEYTLYEECEKELDRNPGVAGVYLYQAKEDVPGKTNYMEKPLPAVIPDEARSETNPAPDRLARNNRYLLDQLKIIRKGRYPFLRLEYTDITQTDYKLTLYRSDNLSRENYYNMIEPANYTNPNTGDIDYGKLNTLIEELKTIRYNTGLPKNHITAPRELLICSNILHSVRDEVEARYANMDHDPEKKRKIMEDTAWEIAGRYFISAYPYYIRAEEEKDKYDIIEAKISELEEKANTPQRLVRMGKMLAVGAILFNEMHNHYEYRINDRPIKLLEVTAADDIIKEKKLFEKLESMRTGTVEEKRIYGRFEDAVEKEFDDKLKAAFEGAFKNLQSGQEGGPDYKEVTRLYEALKSLQEEADATYSSISAHLADKYKGGPTYSKNEVTERFYALYKNALENELEEEGTIHLFRKKLNDLKKQSGPKEEKGTETITTGTSGEDQQPVIIQPGNVRKCLKCGQEGNRGNFCKNCRNPKLWKCSKCGYEENDGAYCENCGADKPEEKPSIWTCPKCGQVGNKGNFCKNCRNPRP